MGGHAFGYHGLGVAEHVLQHFEVLLCQALLSGKRDDLPVGLIHAQYGFLLGGAELQSGQFFAILGDAVVGSDFAAHVEGLCEHECGSANVARVGFKGFGHSCACAVEGLHGGWGILCCAIEELCQFRVLRQNGLRLLHELQGQRGEGCAQVGSQVAQCAFLLVAQD